MRTPFRGWGAAAALLALLAAPGGSGAQQAGSSATRPRSAAEDLQMFSQVLNQIRVNHPDSVDLHTLFMAAIEGMVRAADPHSYVLPAARLSPEKERAHRAGRLYPVPISFTYVGASPVVVSVAQGSAAAALDILPGDELLAIDGEPVSARSAEELAITLSGARGSTVTLTFERQRADGSLVELRRTVKREKLEETSAVPAAFMLDGETGYVRITHFTSEKVAADLRGALQRLESQGMKRLLLDLRDNGGGSLTEAARVAGEFLPTGTVVYTTEGRKEDVRETGKVQRSFWRSERRYPIVALVNGGTASAAELVAGALQDHDRGLIVGRTTFGKSLLMRGFPLSDGSLIMLVVGHVKTPCGRVIQRQYREVTERDYYRLARAERDTVGQPSCRTTGGRVVYGGGGIRPDVLLPERQAAPLWLAQVYEEDLPFRWIAGYLDANPNLLTTLDALAARPSLPPAAVAEFRAFAARQGLEIPAGAEADAMLQRMLVRQAAGAKWREEGYYRITAVLDREVAAALQTFDQAESLLRLSP